MKLAIVVPCFNQLSVTKASISSLFENTSDFTLIFIDDYSTDGTKEYGEKLANTYPNVRFIRNPCNFGVNRSWNVGIKAAKALGAEYTFIINNDILYTKHWEKPMIAALADPKVGVVSPLSTFGAMPKDWPNGTKRAPNPAGYVGYMPILGACFGTRTSLYDDIGYFPEQLRIYYGDNWIVLASQIKGYKCGYVDSYVHHLFCQTTTKLNNSAIWPVEAPIFNQLCKEMGEKNGVSTANNLFKPFIQKGEHWQLQMTRWRVS